MQCFIFAASVSKGNRNSQSTALPMKEMTAIVAYQIHMMIKNI